MEINWSIDTISRRRRCRRRRRRRRLRRRRRRTYHDGICSLTFYGSEERHDIYALGWT